MAGWHAGKTTRIANAISAAMGQKTRFWTEYRIGAAALALAILAKHSPWAKVSRLASGVEAQRRKPLSGSN